MAENVINVNKLPTQPASLLSNQDSVLYVVNNTLVRINQKDFIDLLNLNLKGEKGDRGLTGNRGERGYRGLSGQKGDTGEKGQKGDKGDKGEKGETVYGWSPLFVSVVNNGMVYLYLTDWVGGNDISTKPSQRGYISPNGFVQNISDGATSVSSDFGSAIGQLTQDLALKMPITATTDQISEGSNNRYFTTTRALNTALQNFSTANSSTITASDTIISAFGKTQAQINLSQKKSDVSQDVQNTLLSALSNQSATAISNSDSVIVGFGKLQASINARQTISGLPDAVLSVNLTGFNTSNSTQITASDTVISAFGKTQAQVNLKQNASSLSSDVRAVNLSGLNTSTSGAINSSDSILSSLGKLQAQINALATRVTALETA